MELLDILAIEKAVKELLALEDKLDAAFDKRSKFEEEKPIKPKIIKKATEWSAWLKAIEDFNIDMRTLDYAIDLLEMSKKKLTEDIEDAIPEDMWVKVGAHYIGYKTDNAIGDADHVPELRITEKLPEEYFNKDF